MSVTNKISSDINFYERHKTAINVTAATITTLAILTLAVLAVYGAIHAAEGTMLKSLCQVTCVFGGMSIAVISAAICSECNGLPNWNGSWL